MIRPGYLLPLATLLLSCGETPKELKPVQVETPADEILRLGTTWTASATDQKILSPPAPVSTYRAVFSSRLTLAETSGEEELMNEESLELRNGQHLDCRAGAKVPVQIRFGRRLGEAAVEVLRPPVVLTRNCRGGAHPEPTLELPSARTLLVLKADSLKVVEPTVDRRTYLPEAN